MSWEFLGTITPDKDWLEFLYPLQSRLVRLSFTGETAYLNKFRPRAYLRLRVVGEGFSERWETIWPKTSDDELIYLDPVPIAENILAIRKRRDPYSVNATYSMTVEEYVAEPYLIDYSPQGVTIDGEPVTIDGEPVQI